MKTSVFLFNNTLQSLVTITGLCLVFFLGSCKKDTKTEGTARITFVNAVSTSIPQDLYQGQVKVSSRSIGFGQNTGSITAASRKPIYLTNYGTQVTTKGISINIPAGTSYTYFYTHKKENNSLTILEVQDDTKNLQGKAKVRFANLNNFLSGGITIKDNSGTVIYTNLMHNEISSYVVLDPAAILNIAYKGTAVPVILTDAKLTGGKNYTVWFSGNGSGKVDYHLIVQD